VYDLHGTECCLFHKRLIGAAIGLATGGPGAAVAGFVRGGSKGAGQGRKFAPDTVICPPGTVRFFGPGPPCKATTAPPPRGIVGTGSGPCPPLMKRDFRGDCVFALGEQVGRDDVPVGEAVMGRYGAALVPGNMVVNRAVCLRGMQLGDDGLCYNRGQITNKQRAWPKGRKPLLTGGEMRSIAIAARAAGRLERTTKRLQKIGLMKKPAPRRKAITSGPTEHHHHN